MHRTFSTPNKPTVYHIAGAMLAAVMLAAAWASRAEATIIYPANDGFEVPNLGVNHAYNPGGASWTFVFQTGIASNGSAFGVTGAPNGNSDSTTSAVGQAAFLQGGNGTISAGSSNFFQVLPPFQRGTISVSWLNERRGGQINDYTVVLRDNTLAVDTPFGVFTAPSGASFTPQTSIELPVIAGNSYSLYFVGINTATGDNTVFIDSVFVEFTPAVPEPSTLALLGLGVIGMAFRTRRRRAEA